MKRNFLALLVIVNITVGCQLNMKELESPRPSPTKFMPTQIPTNNAISISTPVSIIELPGPPEEISKFCQFEGFNDFYCPSMRGSSPDNTWQFISCMDIYDCEKPSHYVMFNNKFQDASWIVTNEEISSLAENSPFGWHVAAWSENSQSAYMVYQKFCEHVPRCNYIDAQSVYELNMSSRLTKKILPQGNDLSQDYALAFSPDSKAIAYIITGTQELVIRDLITNYENKIQLSNSEIWYGNISWSPNGDKLVIGSSLNEQVWDFSLWLFDNNGQSITKILSTDNRDFFPITWKDNDTISLHLFGAGADEPFRYIYIVSTGELKLEPIEESDQK